MVNIENKGTTRVNILEKDEETYMHPSAGQLLPPWTKGTMDIHHINTGRGDSTFMIFPDGTTMILDAGSIDPTAPRTNSPRNTPPRPNGDRQPGEWIARYIAHIHPDKTSPRVDYAVISHFHSDHMGALSSVSPMSKSANYHLTGITEVAEHIEIDTLLDRGYPNYDYPEQLLTDPRNANYHAFIDWQIRKNGMRVQRFQPGRNDQIVLRKNRRSYPDFEVRNIVANGEVWTGVGACTRHILPPIEYLELDEYPCENACSIGLRISYGKFDYFNGGDITGIIDLGDPLWLDIETPVAQAVGPVEVNVLNHHGNRSSVNEYYLRALRPRVHILSVWSSDQPGQDVLRRILSEKLYPGPKDVFATNILESNRLVIGELIDQITCDRGHILVRVEPNGDFYWIIILDDTSESFEITGVFGPYESR